MDKINTTFIAKEIFKQYPIYIIIIFILIFLLSLRDITTANILENIIDNINQNKANTEIIKGIYTVGIVWVIITIILYIYDKIIGFIIPKIEEIAKIKMVSKIMNTLQTSYKDFSHSELLIHINKYPEYITEWYNLILTYWLPDIIYAIVICMLLFKYNLHLGMINLVTLFIGYIIFMYYKKIIQLKSSEKENKKKIVYEGISDMFNNSLNILTFDTNDKEIDNIKELEKHYQISYNECYTKSINLKNILTILIYVSSILILFKSIHLINNNLLEIKNLIAIILVLSVWISKMDNFNEQIPVFYYHDATIKNVEHCELFKQILEIENKQNYEINNNALPIIFKNVVFSYDNKKKILNNYNLVIPANQISLIYGPIGKGKTTILNIIMGFYLPQSGTVLMGNMIQKDTSLESWRKHIIYLPQHTVLFNKTLYENIIYGSDKNMDDVNEIIKLFGYTNWVKKFPHGFDSMAGPSGNKFSGGQKQIICLFRCLLNPRPVILLDEPTSSLDKDGKEMVYSLLNKLKETSTVIIVSHDEKIKNYADKLIEFY
jgi:ABC-type bacteriocin/lantibiotic exporter with double-glycine peptidase domain